MSAIRIYRRNWGEEKTDWSIGIPSLSSLLCAKHGANLTGGAGYEVKPSGGDQKRVDTAIKEAGVQFIRIFSSLILKLHSGFSYVGVHSSITWISR